MWFFISVMIAMFCLRNLGWFFSKGFLYQVSTPKAVSFCILWGLLLASLLRWAIVAFHPGAILKVIGFGAGACASIPNYGLSAESTIPPEGLPRHKLLEAVPFWSFIAASIILGYLV
jgi:hypothetical protein